MDSSLPGDYVNLLDKYLILKKDYDEVKQNLHEATRQVKINDALIRECQGEIEVLQSIECSLNQKYEGKISGLEETIVNLRSSHSQNILHLESELVNKEKEIEDLKSELELERRKNLIDKRIDNSFHTHEDTDLLKENELLKNNLDELNEEYNSLRERHDAIEELLQEYREQVTDFKESLEAKREELSEKTALIDKLNDELFTLNSELEIYKNKPLQEGSKGNSLFAEVDDRRVHLQKTVNDMKYGYIHLKQEHSKYEKIITHLRKQNGDLRLLWKKDLEQIQEDQDGVIDALKDRLKVLEEINDRLKRQQEERPKSSSDNMCAEYQFYEDIISSKSAEINKLEKELSDRCLTDHLLSVSLAQARRELRLSRLNLLEFREEMEENKEKDVLSRETEICNRYTMHGDEVIPIKEDNDHEEYEKSDMKSCLKPIENISSGKIDIDVNNENTYHKERGFSIFAKDLSPSQISDLNINDSYSKYSSACIGNDDTNMTISRENQENENFDASKRKGVQFTEETYSPVPNPARRRGTKIFVMKKKNTLTNSSE